MILIQAVLVPVPVQALAIAIAERRKIIKRSPVKGKESTMKATSLSLKEFGRPEPKTQKAIQSHLAVLL